MEAASRFDSILTGQRICDQQGFIRLGDRCDLGSLSHHLFVD